MFRARGGGDSELPLPAGTDADSNAKHRSGWCSCLSRLITRARARPVYTLLLITIICITFATAIHIRTTVLTQLTEQPHTQTQTQTQGGTKGTGESPSLQPHTRATATATATAAPTSPHVDSTHAHNSGLPFVVDSASVGVATSDFTLDNQDLSQKREAIKESFLHAWGGYTKSCWGRDELKPISNTCADWLHGGLTIIDALSTLSVMSLTSELDRARTWVDKEFHFNQDINVSFFESVIRVLGGLLSAYDLTGNAPYLTAARVAGQKLVPAFGSGSGIPLSQVNLRTGVPQSFGWTGGASLLAEIGTVQMEFAALSRVTNDVSYRSKAQHVIDQLDHAQTPYRGLYPIYISPDTVQFTNSKITLGAMGDSFYEYLLKMWLLTGKTNPQYLRMYRESANAIIQHLYTVSPQGDAYLADLEGSSKQHKMDHLVCFSAGMFALGVAHGAVEGDTAKKHMEVAKELMKTCYHMYSGQPSGLAPEYVMFTPNMVPGHDRAYKLRPETVESLMILYRVTHDPVYREWGWQIHLALERSAKIPGGYATVLDVTQATQPEQINGKEDKMESFFLAETLKYLYLLFSPDTVIPITPGGVEASVDKQLWVFNTECHPIRAWKE